MSVVRRAIGAFIVVGIVGGGSGAAAQAPPAKGRSPVQWTAALEAGARPQPGSTVRVVLTATIDTGWHVYSLSQKDGGPIALLVTVPKQPEFTQAGSVIESKPTSKFDTNFNMQTHYFERSPTVTVPVTIARTAPNGVQTLVVEVEYQACSDRLCLPPKTVELKVDMLVGGMAQGGGGALEDRAARSRWAANTESTRHRHFRRTVHR